MFGILNLQEGSLSCPIGAIGHVRRKKSRRYWGRITFETGEAWKIFGLANRKLVS